MTIKVIFEGEAAKLPEAVKRQITLAAQQDGEAPQFFLPPSDRRDPIAKIAHTLANAIRLLHDCGTLRPCSDMSLELGWPAYRELMERHRREHPGPPTPPAIRQAMEQAASAPIDPSDARLVRLRAEIAKRLPRKLRARWIMGELTW